MRLTSNFNTIKSRRRAGRRAASIIPTGPEESHWMASGTPSEPRMFSPPRKKPHSRIPLVDNRSSFYLRIIIQTKLAATNRLHSTVAVYTIQHSLEFLFFPPSWGKMDHNKKSLKIHYRIKSIIILFSNSFPWQIKYFEAENIKRIRRLSIFFPIVRDVAKTVDRKFGLCVRTILFSWWIQPPESPSPLFFFLFFFLFLIPLSSRNGHVRFEIKSLILSLLNELSHAYPFSIHTHTLTHITYTWIHIYGL